MRMDRFFMEYLTPKAILGSKIHANNRVIVIKKTNLMTLVAKSANEVTVNCVFDCR